MEQHVPLLTLDQQEVYDSFCSMVDSNEEGVLFLDAPSGTVKTFLINLILAKLRSQGKITLATASSGIHSCNIVNWRLYLTQVPLDLHSIPIYSIKKGTALCRVIQATVVD